MRKSNLPKKNERQALINDMPIGDKAIHRMGKLSEYFNPRIKNLEKLQSRLNDILCDTADTKQIDAIGNLIRQGDIMLGQLAGINALTKLPRNKENVDNFTAKFRVVFSSLKTAENEISYYELYNELVKAFDDEEMFPPPKGEKVESLLQDLKKTTQKLTIAECSSLVGLICSYLPVSRAELMLAKGACSPNLR